MAIARQSRSVVPVQEAISSVGIAYDGLPKVDWGAHQAALEEAYRKGRDESSSEYKQQILDFRSEVNALRENTFSTLETNFSTILTEAKDALMALTYDCVTRVLGGLEIDAKIVASVVEAVIKESGLNEEKMEVRLNPQDLALLEELEEELASRHAGLSFAADASLKRGDCILSSRFGKVDGLLQTKLDRLKEGLGSRI